MKIEASKAKELLGNIMKDVGDKLDGNQDGDFDVGALVKRIENEARRVGTLPDRAARDPVKYLAGGLVVGMVLGAGVVAPIMVGVARMVARAIGL